MPSKSVHIPDCKMYHSITPGFKQALNCLNFKILSFFKDCPEQACMAVSLIFKDNCTWQACWCRSVDYGS
jgi:hypothetical protein